MSLARASIAVCLFGAVARSQPLAFDVASVKVAKPTGDRIFRNLGTARHGKLTLSNVTLGECIAYAYNIGVYRVQGPDWTRSKTALFEILAQAPPETKLADLRVMLQSLLAERFQLALHREAKDLPFYALVVAKNGHKLEPPKEGPNDFSRIPAPGHRFFNQNQLSMAVFADLLSRQVDRPVLDMTGIKGYFAVKVEWAMDDARETENPGPSLFTALQEQLGLKLEARKGPLEILVIDHAEKVPTEN